MLTKNTVKIKLEPIKIMLLLCATYCLVSVISDEIVQHCNKMFKVKTNKRRKVVKI